MIICKSQIKVYKEGVDSDFNCELLVRRSSVNDEENEVVFIAQDKDETFSKHNIEEVEDTRFYEYLKNMQKKHKEYNLSQDMEYLIKIFEDNKALKYLNINTYSEPFTMKETIDEENKIYVKVTTYELSMKLILKDLLEMDSLDELYNESFSKSIDKYIERKLLEKIYFLKSLKAHRTIVGEECICINKINGHNICEIYLDPIEQTNIKVDNVQGMRVAYLKAFCMKKKNIGKRVKGLTFFEDKDGNDAVIIVKRGDYTIQNVVDIFYMDYFICFGKIVVGVSNYENVKFLEDV